MATEGVKWLNDIILGDTDADTNTSITISNNWNRPFTARFSDNECLMEIIIMHCQLYSFNIVCSCLHH